MNDLDKYAQQLSLFGEMPTVPHPKGFREELHAREKDSIPNPNRHPGQFAPKGGSNPLLKVVEHANGWTASAMLKDGKEFRVEGRDRREAISNAIQAGERMGVIFDPPKAEPALGGLFGENAHPRETINHGTKHAGEFAPKSVKYARVYEQFEEEAERYFRDYTLYDVDRYGMGGGIMKLILSMMAMHAMSGMINSQSQAGQQKQKPSTAAPTTPSNQDFEKLHPRAQTESGNSKPGQFAKKPEGQKQPTKSPDFSDRMKQDENGNWKVNPDARKSEPAANQRQVRPLTERPDKQTQARPQFPAAPQQQNQSPITPAQAYKEWDSANPVQQPQQPIQTPTDPNTARIAEIWHGKDAGQAEDFGAGVDVTPQPLKTEPAAPNPRKKTLPDGSANPDYNPQQINPKEPQPRQKPEKPPAPAKPSLLDREESAPASNQDIFTNPAAKARKEKAELDRITKFDPTEFGEGIEQPDAPMAKPTIESVQGDYTALEAAREERAKQVKENSDWDKKANRDPVANIADVATEHELDHEPFSKYAQEMQAFEESEWKRREGVKTAIRKAWKVDGSDLRTMENRNQDHSNLQRGDELKGSVNDSDLYEFLGPDEGEWSQNAWTMLREEQPERPGAHSKDWLQSHAENFKRLQSMIEPDVQDYPEPEDGMPFSRKSLTKEIDRYFRQHLSRIRATKANSDSQSWTALDSWL